MNAVTASVFFTDPDGHLLELIAMLPAHTGRSQFGQHPRHHPLPHALAVQLRRDGDRLQFDGIC